MMFHDICENFRKFEQVELVENLPSINLPYRVLHNFQQSVLRGKMKVFNILKITIRIKPIVQS